MKSKRIYEYDIVRTIATYSVVIVHISAIALGGYENGSFASLFTILLNRMLKYTTPVFVFLAATLICSKYTKSEFKFLPFIKSRFKRILIPYFFASLMYYVLIAYISGNSISLLTYLGKFLLGTSQYHLYFVPIIVQLYILTPVFLYLKKKVNKPLLLAITAGLNIYAALYVVFQYSDRTFIKYMFPFMLGILYGDKIIEFIKLSKIRTSIILSATLLFGLFYSYQYGLSYYLLPGADGVLTVLLWFIYCSLSCVSLTWLATLISKNVKIRNVSKSISGVSYYIYLYHPLFIIFTIKVLDKLNVQSTTMRFAFTTTVVLVFSTLFAFIVYNSAKYVNLRYNNLKSKLILTKKEKRAVVDKF